jgi:uncharacterized protein
MTRLLLRPFLVLAVVCAAAIGGRGQTSPAVFINEIHYDNTGIDAGELVEIAGPAGTNLADYSIVLYNGAGGATYDTDVLSGTIPDQQNGFGTAILAYPANGIQNGAPDGIALVFRGTVVQFLSYEGTFTATAGPANGLTSTDIGVAESGGEPLGLSLQLVGTGTTYADFTWSEPAGQSPEAVNPGQFFTGTSGPTIAINDVSVTEGHSGTVDATFTVTVSGAHSGVTFDIATADGAGTAPATVADGDYVPRSESAQLIPSGSTTYTFTVAVTGDLTFEPSEHFFVTLGNISGATVADGQGTGTITNDDAAPPVVSDVVISQVYGGGGNAGATFTHDFIELFNRGTSSVSLAGWSLQYTGATSTGTWTVTPLDGSIAPGGYYLVQQAAGAGGTTALPAPDRTGSIAMAAGAGKVALRNTAIAITGACPAPGTSADLVGYGATTCAEGTGATAATSNTLAALRKRGGCFDSDTNNVDFSIGSPTPRNSASPLRACAFVPATIHEIQGAGATTPFLGLDVTTTGIVTARKTNGFFLQTPDDGDGNAATSQAVFVFTSSSPAVAVGDAVTARGTASEFFGLTQLESSLPADVAVESGGHALPAAVTLTTAHLDPAGTPDQLERFEGMRMHADSLISVAPTDEFGETFAVLPGVARPVREPGIEISLPVPPDPTTGVPDCCIPRFDENPERIVIDSDGLAGAPVVLVTSNVTFSRISGPLDFSFGAYKVLPETPPATSANMSAVPVPLPAADEFTIAGFNIENFAGGETQRRKAALAIRQVLRYPDVIGHIEILDLASLQALAAQVNADAVAAGDPDPAYEARLVPASPTATQNVGFLVKTSRVQIDSVMQVGAAETYINPVTGNPETLHDRPPLVLRARVALPGLSPRAFIVVVNHLRSFIDIEAVGGDGLRVRAKRTAQAESTAGLLQALQTDNPATPVISIGDYNAFQFNDGYTDPIAILKGSPTPDDQIVVDESPDLVNPNFINLTDSLPLAERYSFVFEGTPQALDHVLVNGVAGALVRRYAIARNNADFPGQALFAADVTRPERNSDHDMPVAYFAFTPSADVSVTATAPSAPVPTGGAFTYSVMISNQGPDDASGVALSIPAQPGVRFSTLQSPAGWSCTTPAPGATGVVSCTAASLAAGAAATFVVTASLDCSVANAALVNQSVSVSGATPDPVPANNLTAIAIAAANPPPTISGVLPLVVVSPVPGASRAGAVVGDAVLGLPSIADNCEGATLVRSGVPAGNLFPVGLTTVTYTATDSGGATAAASTTVHVRNAVESLEAIAVDLEAILDASTRPALSRRVEDALERVRRAIAELGATRPDHRRAVVAITAALGELEDVLRRNLFDAAATRDLLMRLTGVSWLLARQDLEAAVARRGNIVLIALANASIQQANGEAARGHYQLASGLYWLAVGLALQA